MRTFTSIFCLLALSLPWFNAAAGNKCNAEEYMVLSSPQAKPEWVDKLRFPEGGKEYFTALSSQNERIEAGILTAVDNANAAILEAVGQVMQTKNETLITLTVDDVRKSLGSREATAYFRHKKREAVYYEKWATYKNCTKSYYYNVWALMSVPRNELEKEADKATIFLLNLQETENKGKGGGLLPDIKATHIDEMPKVKTPPPPVHAQKAFEPPKSFRCGNITIMGGIDQPMGSQQTNRGKFDKWGFNISFSGEFSITPNVCGGLGVGYATVRTDSGGTGSIVPFTFSVAVKFPMGWNNSVIPWIGAEVGPAVLYGFRNKSERDKWSGETSIKKKVDGGFWAAGMAGIDIKIQKGLYLTINGAYVPVVSSETFQFIMGRAGIRYHF